jgi:hypothetical protein
VQVHVDLEKKNSVRGDKETWDRRCGGLGETHSTIARAGVHGPMA